MIFTRHAYERYRQFHMLDRPTATDEDARVVLDAHANDAVRLPGRTFRGDEVWTIHALGIELVVKRDMPEPVCVTVLPPARFRGLTPLLVERVEASAREAKERAQTKQALAEAEVALAAQAKEAKQKAHVTRQVLAHVEALQRKATAQQELAERVIKAKHEAALALAEHNVLLSTLKTMRAQLAREHDAYTYKAALRIAVRALRDAGVTEALDAIAKIQPGLVSDKFIDGEDP